MRILKSADYARTPWKNGGGITEDILLLPPGAGHEDFEIRVSLAPITAEGPFSSYPGIDRHITRLSDSAVLLDFGGHVLRLERLEPFLFDSVLAPASRLPDGPARVINVMTRRGCWSAEVFVHRDGGRLDLAAPAGGYVLAYAISGDWTAGGQSLAGGDTAISEDSLTLTGAAGEILVARIAPAKDQPAR